MNIDEIKDFMTKVYESVDYATTFSQTCTENERDEKALKAIRDLKYFINFNSQYISKTHLENLNYFIDISTSNIYLMKELRFDRMNFLYEKIIPRQDYCTLNRRKEWVSLNEYVENDFLKLKNSLIS